MVGTIIKSSFNADYRVSSQRSFQNTFLKSFFNCREIVLRHCSTNNYLLKYIWCFQITGWFKTHFNMTILSVSARLFFMFAFHIRVLANGLAECNLRFGKFNIYFVTFFQFADHDIKMLITHTIKECLSVGRIIYNTKGLVFACHFCESLCNFVLITLVDCFVSLICVRCGDHSLRIENRSSFGCKAVTGLYACKFCNGTDITCMKLRNFDRFGAFQDI